jgi:sn-glycerol 3-phosphate transport system permease protein
MREGTPVFKSRTTAWLLLLPTLVILLIFLYYPAIQSFVLSLYRSNLILGTRRYIGLGNFRLLFTGLLAPMYRQVVVQSLVFSAAVVFFGIAISLAFSMLANQKVTGSRVYRLLLIWPFAMSPAIAGTIFSFLFNPEAGEINHVLSNVFGIAPRWLDNPILAFGLVVCAAIWKELGYNIVFYLAALQNIPGELTEAAAIEGANAWQRFRSITLPLLSPITFFLVFTNLAYAFFEVFGLIDILTKGGPVGPAALHLDNAGLTTTMIYRLYEDGFGGAGNLGFAGAQGVILLFIVGVITLLQFRYGNRNVHYGGG